MREKMCRAIVFFSLGFYQRCDVFIIIFFQQEIITVFGFAVIGYCSFGWYLEVNNIDLKSLKSVVKYRHRNWLLGSYFFHEFRVGKNQ